MNALRLLLLAGLCALLLACQAPLVAPVSTEPPAPVPTFTPTAPAVPSANAPAAQLGLAVYTGDNVYSAEWPQWSVEYDPASWELVQEPDNAMLRSLAQPACRLMLTSGPIGGPTQEEVTLGQYTWRIMPTLHDQGLHYSTPFDPYHAYFLGVNYSPDAPQEEKDHCRALAEEVIATFTVAQGVTASAPLYRAYTVEGNVAWSWTDDDHLYWALQESQTIYRAGFEGEPPEQLAGSSHAGGYVTVLKPQVTQDWLIFTDTNIEAVYSPYLLRAVNLRTGADRILLSDQRAEGFPPDFAVFEEWVAFAAREASETPGCPADSIIAVQHIPTGASTEMDRICIDDAIFFLGGISETHIIAMQADSDANGAGRRIILFDRRTGERTLLSGGAQGTLPALSGNWAAWREMLELGGAGDTILLNLATGEQTRLATPPSSGDVRLVAGRWLHWNALDRGTLPFYDVQSGEHFGLTLAEMEQNGAIHLFSQLTGSSAVWNTIEFLQAEMPGQRQTQWRTTIHWLTGADPRTLAANAQRVISENER